MRSLPPTLTLCFFLAGCGTGDWSVSAWGEDYIEAGIPAEEFEDGCSASFERFSVEFSDASLRTPQEEVVGEIPVGRVELTEPGPHALGTVAVAPGTYDRVYYSIGSSSEASVQTAGTVTCGDTSVAFDWSFNPSVRYRCLADAPLEVLVPDGGEVTTSSPSTAITSSTTASPAKERGSAARPLSMRTRMQTALSPWRSWRQSSSRAWATRWAPTQTSSTTPIFSPSW